MKTDIKWDKNEEIGYSEFLDIITKRRVYYIRLSNNQVKEVADVTVYVNPFPPKGESHISAIEKNLKLATGLEYMPEFSLYAQALFESGKWANSFK